MKEGTGKDVSRADINVGKRILTPHSLRYTHITRMRRDVAGETVKKLQVILLWQ